MKPPVVSISSDDDDDEEEEELESEFSSEDDGDDSDSDYQEYDEEEEDDFESNGEECSENDDELRDRVNSLHQGSNDLQELSLNECKAYLRKHALRLSGTKEECLQRIKEHQRLKDGRGKSLYPISSFSINCTGDACKGDIVMFTQKVYQKFDKAMRRGNVLGKRTIAGKIVKESYGAAKQQHTFTVEVLWSKGFKKLSPLSTLLVKGRNLYRFRTLRQPWESEAERSKVLGEKHKRGEAARHKRKLKKIEIASNMKEGKKRQKLTNKGQPRMKQPTRRNKHDFTKTDKMNTPICKKKTTRFQKTQVKRSTQPVFRSNPNPFIYPDRHQHEASTSSFMHNTPPIEFSFYRHYNNGPPQPGHTLYRFPGYNHYNYEQPDPRYRPG